MKNTSLFIILISTITIGLQSCVSKCEQKVYYSAKVPIYESLEKIRNSIKFSKPKTIISVDQIVESSEAYFLLEKNQGIHVLNKTTSPNIIKSGYIEASLCTEICTNKNFLVLFQANDIVTLDVSSFDQVIEISRVANIINQSFVRNDSFVVRYDTMDVVKIIPDANCGNNFINAAEFESNELTTIPHAACAKLNSEIYVCDNERLVVFSVDTITGKLTFRSSQSIGFGNLESPGISLDSSILIAGRANSRLFPFAINNSPLSPIRANFSVPSVFSCGSFHLINNHIFFPDFAEEKNNNRCFPNGSMFIRNVNGSVSPFVNLAPQFAESRHLSTDGNTSLLSDGNAGFILLNVTTPQSFNFTTDILGSFSSIHAKRSLFSKGNALIWGDDGLFLFDVSDPSNIIQTSKIE